ncbi:MAG: GNAT family N-acetyltransferase [Fluviicola sp.]
MKPSQKDIDRYYLLHESERLFFRNLEESDIERWIPFFEDEETLSHVGMLSGPFKFLGNPDRSRAWLLKQMERRKKGVFGQLAVVEKETQKFIGVGGIIFREEKEAYGEWEIAYSLLPEARGRGYATELARYFRDWAFANTEVESLVSFVHVNNSASQKVTEKNGMHVEKELTFFEMPCRLNRVIRGEVDVVG